MAGRKHLVIWPKVRVTVNDKRVTLTKGDDVPAGISAVDLANLVSFGAIAGAGAAEPENAESDSTKESSVKDILAEVGDDKDKAAAALELEKAGKSRKTLIEPLEAIVNPS